MKGRLNEAHGKHVEHGMCRTLKKKAKKQYKNKTESQADFKFILFFFVSLNQNNIYFKKPKKSPPFVLSFFFFGPRV